ncbi:YncE family protein [Sorangium sp. So ce341]|uniref:YncE family protein n=1 Tax=Sorangium sp. So ce341 TaxID=3133302 RepID=UPI003F64521B
MTPVPSSPSPTTTPPSSLPHATTPKELTIERAIAVGKSPVHVVVAGDTAWVTERGERRIAKVDLKRGNVVAHVEVGGPLIQIAAAPDGTIFALTSTDQAI